MGFITLPEKLRPREILEALELEIETLKRQIDSREKTLEEIGKMAAETKEAEEKLLANRKELFKLLVEKIRSSELSGLDQYCRWVDEELDRIEQRKNKATGGGAAKS